MESLTRNDRHRLLLGLANFLDDLPHSKFHIPQWTSQDATEHSCGTAGCVAGWAATIYQKYGYELKYSEAVKKFIPYYHTWGFYSFAKFFDINGQDALNLTSNKNFYQTNYDVNFHDVTPQIAAQAIRDLLKSINPDILKEEQAVKIEEEYVEQLSGC